MVPGSKSAGKKINVATINLPTYYLRSKGYLECSTTANPENPLSSDYFEQKTAKRLSRNQSGENLTQSRLPPASRIPLLWRTGRPISPFSYVGQGRRDALFA